MEMSIVWTDKAKYHLKLIQLFYLETASFMVSESVVNGLIDKVTNFSVRKKFNHVLIYY
jgi:hypothetical protein